MGHAPDLVDPTDGGLEAPGRRHAEGAGEPQHESHPLQEQVGLAERPYALPGPIPRDDRMW